MDDAEVSAILAAVFFGCAVAWSTAKRQASANAPTASYTTQRFAAFPIFSLAKWPSTAAHEETVAYCGGGGGADYGVLNRLEVGSTARKNNNQLPLIQGASFLPDVYDCIRPLTLADGRRFFAAGAGADCVLVALSDKNRPEEVLRWPTVARHQQGRKHWTQERCAVYQDLVATAGEDGSLTLWRVDFEKYTVKRLKQFAPFHDGRGVADLQFAADGSVLLVATREGSLLVVGPLLARLWPPRVVGVDVIHCLDVARELGVAAKPRVILPLAGQHQQQQQQDPQQQKGPHRAKLEFVVLANVLPPKRGGVVARLELHLSMPPAEFGGEVAVAWNRKALRWDSAYMGVSAGDVSDGRVVLATNTQIHLLSAENLRPLMSAMRSVPLYSDMPVTGCCFVNGGSGVLTASGDYSLSLVDLAKAKSHARRNRWPSLWTRGLAVMLSRSVADLLMAAATTLCLLSVWSYLFGRSGTPTAWTTDLWVGV